MTELLTSAQMRAVEAAAIASGEVTGLELMERAGRGVVDAVFAEWPELAAGSFRAVVLCGPGNNGGDGFVVARVLKEWGWEVEVFLYGTPEGMPADARVSYERWMGLGEVRELGMYETGRGDALTVDALFGTGPSRPLDDEAAWALNIANNRHLPNLKYKTVAIDIPSGLCADSGRVLVSPGSVIERVGDRVPAADLTVTFERKKIGHMIAAGPDRCARVVVVPLGIRHEIDGPLYNSETSIAEDAKVRSYLLRKATGDHKYAHGHALILSGGVGHGGAARLAARGALRIGAGLVTLGCPPAAVIENAAQVTAVMLKRVADAAGLAAVLEDRRINALCIGPGLAVERAEALLAVALGKGVGVEPRPAGERLAVVLDADALTALAGDAALFGMLHDRCVLTPHGGEFARLFPDIAERLAAPALRGPAYSKVDATREAAKRAGCVVLFKGADTVIADTSGNCSINSAAYDRAAPWLATAGSGDVLAGFITGLLARGIGPMQAAETAAWLHVECARSFGPGLIAEDLPEELPRVFRALGL